MKVTKRQLRRIIREEKARFLNEINWERLADEMDVDPQIRKVGDLRKIIKTLQSEKRAKLGIEGLKDLGIGALADIVPGAGTALSLAQTLKSMYSAPDDKKTDTMLDKLNVDDEVAAIVDDTVEDNFLNVALDSLEGLSDEDDIPDINEKLASWLKSKYDARTVDGFQEGKRVKVSKKQLRRVIREALLAESRPGHKDPESGNWQYPGDDGYDPRKDKTLRDWGNDEYSIAIDAHRPKLFGNGEVDPSWVHPADRGGRY